MTDHTPHSDQPESGRVQRRTIVQGAAWTVPIVAASVATPAFAASNPPLTPTLQWISVPNVKGCETGTFTARATTDGTTPAAGKATFVTPPSGWTWPDGGTNRRSVRTNSQGVASYQLVAPYRTNDDGTYNLTVTDNSLTDTDRARATTSDRSGLGDIIAWNPADSSYTVQAANQPVNGIVRFEATDNPTGSSTTLTLYENGDLWANGARRDTGVLQADTSASNATPGVTYLKNDGSSYVWSQANGIVRRETGISNTLSRDGVRFEAVENPSGDSTWMLLTGTDSSQRLVVNGVTASGNVTAADTGVTNNTPFVSFVTSDGAVWVRVNGANTRIGTITPGLAARIQRYEVVENSGGLSVIMIRDTNGGLSAIAQQPDLSWGPWTQLRSGGVAQADTGTTAGNPTIIYMSNGGAVQKITWTNGVASAEESQATEPSGSITDISRFEAAENANGFSTYAFLNGNELRANGARRDTGVVAMDVGVSGGRPLVYYIKPYTGCA
ncbi:hypothetical protein [Rathayibacter tanaceti]|uniref:Uncharacterized protein n=2 Tax=Rathayibacter tanaceti TaxID=1671680 RepID=A0A166HXR7_9MICO|nr:hypothetical protein [Rathayibacter tanaceti]KZX21314.1 hypothetical protein ACH61_01547 [Rathayibacter tanaceti]QHC54278.1 hypothetical protein GSU10_00460 [Rathayibacter tanaceti]TCO37956.1 hypothetical protein EV639_103143 [Rathayibacter tanaceti]